ncbi:hypothetical protein N7454_005151, partial [Penicillium verhagenii]
DSKRQNIIKAIRIIANSVTNINSKSHPRWTSPATGSSASSPNDNNAAVRNTVASTSPAHW